MGANFVSIEAIVISGSGVVGVGAEEVVIVVVVVVIVVFVVSIFGSFASSFSAMSDDKVSTGASSCFCTFSFAWTGLTS